MSFPFLEHPNSELFFLGYQPDFGIPIGIHKKMLGRHVLIVGLPGTGKTQLIFYIILLAMMQGITVIAEDHKHELVRLCGKSPNVLVIRAGLDPWNFLDPIGDEESWYSTVFTALGSAFALWPETYSALPGIIARYLHTKRKRGENIIYPSPADFRQILLRQHQIDKRGKWDTAANAIISLSAVLGKNIRLVRGIRLYDYFSCTVYQKEGTVDTSDKFSSTLRALRLVRETALESYTPDVARLLIYDEARFLVSKEQTFGEKYSPVKNLITQARSTGTGVILGTQTLTDLDTEVKTSCGTFISFALKGEQAIAACQLHGMPIRFAPELEKLKPGQAFVSSVGFPYPVKVQVHFCEMGEYPSYSLVAQRMRPYWDWIDSQCIFSHTEDDLAPLEFDIPLQPKPKAVEPLEDDLFADASPKAGKLGDRHIEAIEFIREHPGIATSNFYSDFGIHPKSGSALLEELKENGKICFERREGKGRPAWTLYAND